MSGAGEIVGGRAGSGQPPGQDRSGVTTGGQGVESGQSTTDLVPDASSASSVRSDSPTTSVRTEELDADSCLHCLHRLTSHHSGDFITFTCHCGCTLNANAERGDVDVQ